MLTATQRLGSFEHLGRSVAYAIVGEGPPLLCDLARLHHLDVFWRYPPYRRLVEGLARDFTVARLDRPGCGLSDRAAADFTIEAELRLFDRFLDHLRLEQTAVLAASSAAPVMIAVAARRPERVSRLAVFGAWATPAATDSAGYEEALDTLLRTQFTIACEVLAQATAAGCPAAAARWLAGAYREAAAGDVVADWLRETVWLDIRALLGDVRCPVLVLHRRDSPLGDLLRVRDVAAGIQDAVLLPLDGSASVIWEGDVEPLLGALVRFLAPAGADGPDAAAAGLTPREREIASLVAEGLTNADIGARLGIGRRTVESHLERARSRLGLLSRADLAAWAARAGLSEP